ncbi:hypothetical protein U5A82_02280 [Sphingobium sp. CR2-8]|uniref:hypothetical protein n=1 Tax=Sphingobium sp. CR2-8 TaxID=1306534 RepID=UPI002DB59DA1|nr:hypothetical protein [Sphingobium sp. CR2-8]MEC3909341.1 hypothetical protein [Sphingobium sp. CR2-8]
MIWDNLATMHPDFDICKERRDMRRTTVRKGEPPEHAGDPLIACFAASAPIG